jgi:hypothetical protein
MRKTASGQLVAEKAAEDAHENAFESAALYFDTAIDAVIIFSHDSLNLSEAELAKLRQWLAASAIAEVGFATRGNSWAMVLDARNEDRPRIREAYGNILRELYPDDYANYAKKDFHPVWDRGEKRYIDLATLAALAKQS